MKPPVRHTFVNLSVAGVSVAIIAASWAGIARGDTAASGDPPAAITARPREDEPGFRWPIEFDGDDEEEHRRFIQAPAQRTTPAPAPVAPPVVAPAATVAPQSVAPVTAAPAPVVTPPTVTSSARAPVPALVPAPKATVAPAAPPRRRSRAS